MTSKMKQLLNGKKVVIIPPAMYNEIERVAGFKEAERFEKEPKVKKGKKVSK